MPEGFPAKGGFQPLHPWQVAKMERLQAERPSVVRKDLKCPDCGAKLTLRVGRYGRFYGCVKGAISANDDGTPRGIPAKAQVRTLRKQVMDALEGRRQNHFRDGDFLGPPPDWEGDPDWPKTEGVGRWGKKDCLKALGVMGIEPKLDPPPTRYERILADDWLD